MLFASNMTANITTSEMANATESVYFHKGVIGSQLSLCAVSETLGNFMLLAVILYEMYGMNPQKRTVSNQLLSSMCMVLIMFNLSIVPVWCVSRFGAFQSIIPRVIVLFGVHGTLLFCLLTSTEIIIVKLIYIYQFTTIAQANEYVITMKINLFNGIIIATCLLTRWLTGEYLFTPVTISDGAQVSAFHKTINFLVLWLPVVICLIISVIGLPLIYIKKRKAKQMPSNIIPMSNLKPSNAETEPQESEAEQTEPPKLGTEPSKSDTEPPKAEIETLDAEALASKSRIIFVKPINIEEDLEVIGPHSISIIMIEDNKDKENENEEHQEDKANETHSDTAVEEEANETHSDIVANEEGIEPKPQEMNVNSNKFNKNLVGYGALILLLTSIAMLSAPLILAAQFNVKMSEMMKLYIFVFYNILIIGLPGLFFWTKPRRFDCVLELFH